MLTRAFGCPTSVTQSVAEEIAEMELSFASTEEEIVFYPRMFDTNKEWCPSSRKASETQGSRTKQHTPMDCREIIGVSHLSGTGFFRKIL
jgi:hypothetical protein